MAHAYTPGLKVTRSTIVRHRRLLPIPGDVSVKVGDEVKAEQAVARTVLPGKVKVVNAMNALGISAKELPEFMVKKRGDRVAMGESIAETKPLFKFLSFLKATVPSPIEGVVDEISDVTGQVMLREPPVPLELEAYVDGFVAEVFEGQGIVVETRATMIQGIFGIGGETHGEVEIAVPSPTDPLDAGCIRPEHKDKVVVGGSLLTLDAVEAAVKVGAAGLVAGGIHDRDVRKLLGYDIGVAITGTEELGITLILTEGFGTIPMAQRTFDLLSEIRGQRASISGATQIRAGVMRPEIIVSRGKAAETEEKAFEAEGIQVGTVVRVIREPHFGQIGKVTALPHEPEVIETGSKVRILSVDLGTGEEATVPRANVELIEE
jgi:hypothetical protein